MHRVADLADRPVGFIPKDAIPFKNRIPLEEIIADVKGVGVSSQTVQNEYEAIISIFGNEFNVLSEVPKEDLMKSISPKIADGIIKAREGKVEIAPGYDGEFGKIKIKSDSGSAAKEEQQLSLF